MLNYLKIKCVSLGAEAKLIRNDENKRIRFARNARSSFHNINHAEYHDRVRRGLHHHRITIVRVEARAANLAYAFCRGYKYSDIERKCYESPDWYKIRKLINSYGYDPAATAEPDDYDLWKNEGIAYIQQTRANELAVKLAKEQEKKEVE